MLASGRGGVSCSRPLVPNLTLCSLRKQGVDGKWKYQGGEIHLESIPRTWRYADLMHRLAERSNGAVSLKYFEPSDEIDPDNLITVSDDDDLQVSCGCTFASMLICRQHCRGFGQRFGLLLLFWL